MPKDVMEWPNGVTPIAPLSPATMADGVIYISGTLAFQEDGSIGPVGDAAGQTRIVLDTIKAILGEAGGGMDDIAMAHVFLKSWDDYAAVNGVYETYFPGKKPARFCIACGLARPEALVEIAGIAHVGKPPSHPLAG